MDIWSLGCILSELSTGKPLFGGPTKEHIIAQILSVNENIPEYFQRKKLKIKPDIKIDLN